MSNLLPREPKSNVNWGSKAAMAVCKYVDKAYPRRSRSLRVAYNAFHDETECDLWIGKCDDTNRPSFRVYIPCNEQGVRATPMLIEQARNRAEERAGCTVFKVEGQPDVDTSRPARTKTEKSASIASGSRRVKTAKATERKDASSSAKADTGTSASTRRSSSSRTASSSLTSAPKPRWRAKPATPSAKPRSRTRTARS